MLKVLITAPSLDTSRNVSGVSSVVRHILRVLSGRVQFIHLQIGSEQGGSRLGRPMRSLRKLLGAMGKVLLARYDVLHSNTALNEKSVLRDAVLVGLASLRGKPVVLHLHGGRFIHDQPKPPFGWVMGFIFRRSATILVLSHLEKVRMAELFPQSAGKLRVLYNGVELPPERERIASGPLRVAFIGRLAEEKGIAELAQAITALDDDDTIAFSIHGEGPLRPLVEKLAASTRNTRFFGPFPAGSVNKILADVDVLVLPSRRGEGMPMAAIEAMAAGVVPVATTISSIPEIIADGETGFLLPPGSWRALVDTLTQLQRAELARIGASARRFAAANLDASANFARLVHIYAALAPRARDSDA